MSDTREKRFENLRPMSVPDVLDVAFRLYRGNFWLLIKIYAVLYLPLNALLIPVASLAYRSATDVPSINIPLSLFQYILSLINVAAEWVATAAIVKAVSATFLEEKTDVRACYQFIRPRILPLIVSLLMFYLIVALGCCLCFIPGWIFGIWFMFVTQIVVLEGATYTAALARSKQLVTGQFWKVTAAMALSLLLGYVLIAVVMAPGTLMMVISGGLSAFSGNTHPEISPMLMAGVMLNSLVANMLFYPFLGIVITLLYYDLRIRKEGLDLELMAQEAGYTTPAEG